MNNYTKTRSLSLGRDFIQFECGDLNLTVWKDKAVMYLFDNVCNPNCFVEITRKYKNETVTAAVPVVIREYCLKKNWVDVGNEIRAGFGIERRCTRIHTNTWMAAAEQIIFCNAALLWADLHQLKRYDASQLRSEWIDCIVRQWHNEYPSKMKLRPRRRTKQVLERNSLGSAKQHRLEKYRGKSKQIQCVHHSLYLQERKDTTWHCPACEVHGNPAGFCKKHGCFDNYIVHRDMRQSAQNMDNDPQLYSHRRLRAQALAAGNNNNRQQRRARSRSRSRSRHNALVSDGSSDEYSDEEKAYELNNDRLVLRVSVLEPDDGVYLEGFSDCVDDIDLDSGVESDGVDDAAHD